MIGRGEYMDIHCSMKNKVLFSHDQISDRIKHLANEIKYSGDFSTNEKLYIICVLKGSFIFTADLIRNLEDFDCVVDFIQLSSYGEKTVSSGIVTIKKDIDISIKRRNVLVVEDIVDTGYTMKFLVNYLNVKEPKQIKTCALLDKKSCRKVEFEVNYVGFEIPNYYVVGYGLDYDDRFRHLPNIFVQVEEKECIENNET